MDAAVSYGLLGYQSPWMIFAETFELNGGQHSYLMPINYHARGEGGSTYHY